MYFGFESAAAYGKRGEECGSVAVCAFAARARDRSEVQRICGGCKLLRGSGCGEEMASGHECGDEFEPFLQVRILLPRDGGHLPSVLQNVFGARAALRQEGHKPLVRISLREGTTPEYRKAIAEGVHQAMVEAMAVPAQDRFQVISEYKGGRFDL
jgi:hypothetical protein